MNIPSLKKSIVLVKEKNLFVGLLLIVSSYIFPKYEIHTFFILRNKFKSLLYSKPKKKFLFILSPQYTGSTLLNQIICTSKSVSVNNIFYNREGQTLPTVRNIMARHNRRWDPTLDYDWSYIKSEWMKYWDLTAQILLEKSPPNIIRAGSIEKAFNPSFFIILFRNPYAHCEGLLRRNGWSTTRAALFSIQCLKYQRKNIETLQNSIVVTYSMLTSDTEETFNKISKFIPELTDINFRKKFSANNSATRKKTNLADLDKSKIDKLSSLQLTQINEVFGEELEILEYFDFSIIESS